MENNVTRNGHGVLEVTLNLVDDVLRWAAEENCASLGVLALPEESEVFVTNLLDLEETAPSSHVGFLDIVHTVDNRCTRSSGDTVVVRLPHSAERCDVGLHQKVLCEIYTPMSGTKNN